MMRTITTNGSVMRWLKLILGVFALVQSIIQKDVPLGLVAGLLLFTAIANVGCCGSTGCAVKYNKHKKESEVAYEELDGKK